MYCVYIYICHDKSNTIRDLFRLIVAWVTCRTLRMCAQTHGDRWNRRTTSVFKIPRRHKSRWSSECLGILVRFWSRTLGVCVLQGHEQRCTSLYVITHAADARSSTRVRHKEGLWDDMAFTWRLWNFWRLCGSCIYLLGFPVAKMLTGWDFELQSRLLWCGCSEGLAVRAGSQRILGTGEKVWSTSWWWESPPETRAVSGGILQLRGWEGICESKQGVHGYCHGSPQMAGRCSLPSGGEQKRSICGAKCRRTNQQGEFQPCGRSWNPWPRGATAALDESGTGGPAQRGSLTKLWLKKCQLTHLGVSENGVYIPPKWIKWQFSWEHPRILRWPILPTNLCVEDSSSGSL